MHNIMSSNKPLFNLQLAATHIAFMLDHESNGKVQIIFISVLVPYNISEIRVFLIFRPQCPLLPLQIPCLTSHIVYTFNSINFSSYQVIFQRASRYC